MEDDGGSPITNGVRGDIKAAVRKVIQYLESAHGITGQKVSQQEKQTINKINVTGLFYLNLVSYHHIFFLNIRHSSFTL
jgi:hypothetical protein